MSVAVNESHTPQMLGVKNSHLCIAVKQNPNGHCHTSVLESLLNYIRKYIDM